jgi:hypothetical protein
MRQIIDSTQIDQWFVSARRDAQETLPHLVRKLISGTVDPQALVSLRIPVGDDIRRPGYDGRVETTAAHPFVPEGQSVWEMGTGEPGDKAEKDYRSRCEKPQGVDAKLVTFVLVSPHIWGDKDKWASEKTREGVWKEVRALDNADLAAWLEMAPGVARWLARQMGVPVDGFRDLDLYWAELGAQWGVPVVPDLLIGGRDEALKEFHAWLDSTGGEIRVEGESLEEALAFAAAAIRKLPRERIDKVVPRIVLVDQPVAMEYLGGLQGLHFVVPTTTVAAHRALALRLPAVRLILPCARAAGGAARTKTILRLGTVRREACEKALIEIGFEPQRAGRIAFGCKGSLTAVQWMVSAGQDMNLPWVSAEAAVDLVPLLLAGKGTPDNENDRAIIETLCGRAYKDIERTIAKWTAPTGPLIRRGRIWDWLARDFAWDRLAPFVERRQLDAFREVVIKVLGSVDPRLDLPADHRWAAPIYGKVHPYSHALQSGLVESVAQVALHETSIRGVAAQDFANALVAALLRGAVVQRKSAWLSLAPWLPDLAEAAPDAFLVAVEDFLRDGDAVRAMFEEESGLFPCSQHIHLLWALERLAWSKELLTRVTLILGNLAAVDPGGHLSNRPSKSLKEIFLTWFPQTMADVADRLDAIDVLHERYPDTAWDLAVALLPTGWGTSTSTAEPDWRRWKTTDKPIVTVADYWRFTEELVARIIQWAGLSGTRWSALVSAYGNLRTKHPDLAARVLNALTQLDTGAMLDADRRSICDRLRSLIAWHGRRDDAEDAPRLEIIAVYESLRLKFEPADLFDRHCWLFGSSPDFPSDRHLTYDEEMRHIQDERVLALKAIYDVHGVNGALELAERVERPDSVGFALADLNLDHAAEAELLRRTLGAVPAREGMPALLQVAAGYVSRAFYARGTCWVDQAISMDEVGWNGPKYANFALGLPPEGATWDRLEQWGEEATTLYWSRVPRIFPRNPMRDGARAMRNLLKVGRPYRAVEMIGTSLHLRTREPDAAPMWAIPKELIVEALMEAPKRDPASEPYPLATNTLAYELGQILDALEQQGADNSTLAGLEWAWMPALENSGRGLKALQCALSEDANLFVDVLKAVFRGENEEPSSISEHELERGRQCGQLLKAWKRVPGTRRQEFSVKESEGDIAFDQGEVEERNLLAWVEDARRLAAACGRLGVCDSHIGEVLAHAPQDIDGRWPCEPVRNLIERLVSERMETGLEVAIYNRRGAFCRAKGGEQERCLAAKFRRYEEQVHSRWPRTAAVLIRIAETYEREARREDDREAFEEFE